MLFRSIELHLDAEKLQQSFTALIQGFSDYSAQDPASDVSALGAAVQDYLGSDAARTILAEQIQALLSEKTQNLIDGAALQQALQSVLEGYPAFAAQQPDPQDYETNFQAYLQSPEVQSIISGQVTQIEAAAEQLQVTPQELGSLVSALAQGYSDYAAQNGKPQPDKIVSTFSAYLNTQEAKDLLTQAVSDSVDFSGLEKKINQMMGTAAGQFANALSSQLSRAMTLLASRLQTALTASFSTMFSSLDQMFNLDPDAFAGAIKMNMTEQELQSLLSSLLSTENHTYENNLKSLGYQPLDVPDTIYIYPKDFEAKQEIGGIIEAYNTAAEAAGEEDRVIQYTDMVGALMGSVTDIVDIVSYVLIAFVAISLVVSSIMIGVITYISVLERKKEIGILRSIGASKGNIANVFNAETMITGFLAGLIGVGLTLLILIPANLILHAVTGHPEINAVLPPLGGVLLVLLSVGLTLIGGLIPSGKAARSDPVTALRTE